MDNRTQKEINSFHNDVKASMDNLDASKDSFANKLKNGLGDEIIDFLEHASKRPEKKKNLWSRISDLF